MEEQIEAYMELGYSRIEAEELVRQEQLEIYMQCSN